jgi:cytidylate kinase
MSRGIEQLVERQVLRWLEEERVSLHPPAPRAEEAPARPVICISRQFGAFGGEVGRQVAERLGFAFYGQELVDEIAKQAHVRRKVVESLDERIQLGIRQWVDELMVVRQFRSSDYLTNLSHVVLTLGRHGRSVVIGRGAHLILDPKSTLRLRCYAPLSWRIAQVAERWELTPADAEAMIKRVDREREAFYRAHFNVDVSEPEHFDFLLNVSTMSLETCAQVVVDAFEARFSDDASMPPKSQVRTSAQDSGAPAGNRRSA